MAVRVNVAQVFRPEVFDVALDLIVRCNRNQVARTAEYSAASIRALSAAHNVAAAIAEDQRPTLKTPKTNSKGMQRITNNHQIGVQRKRCQALPSRSGRETGKSMPEIYSREQPRVNAQNYRNERAGLWDVPVRRGSLGRISPVRSLPK